MNSHLEIQAFFAWYDFWVGMYFDRKDRALYVCLLPCVVFKFKIHHVR